MIPSSYLSVPTTVVFSSFHCSYLIFSLLSAFPTPTQTQLHSKGYLSEMQIGSCHFSAQKLLFPPAYRLESKLISMAVKAFEELTLARILALFFNVISPNLLYSLLCELLDMQPFHLDFSAVKKGSVASNKYSAQIEFNNEVYAFIGSQIGKSRDQ